MSVGIISSAGLSSPMFLRSYSANFVHVNDLPGTAERAERSTERAEQMIESLARTMAGRMNGVDGYKAKLQYEQKYVDKINAQIAQLPGGTSAQQRNAWNSALLEAQEEANYSRSQVAFYQSISGSDSGMALVEKSIARQLGISTEEVHKLYMNRANAIRAEEAAAKAAQAEAQAAASAGSEYEWGSEASGLRAEIKVNGVVVGRIFNNGATVMRDEYADLGFDLGWGMPGEDRFDGPDLAQRRIAQLANHFKNSKFEVTMAPTAMTQAEWLQYKTGGGVNRSV